MQKREMDSYRQGCREPVRVCAIINYIPHAKYFIIKVLPLLMVTHVELPTVISNKPFT